MAAIDDRPELIVTRRLQREKRWFGPGGGEEHRDRIMRELRGAGLTTEEARNRCYATLDRLFPPLPDDATADTTPPQFAGYTGDLDALIDPQYAEPDAGCRLRDSYTWVGDEFRRITQDMADGTTRQDFARAKTPPPTPLAVAIAEYYGEHRAKRGELFSRLAQFASREHQLSPVDDSRAGFLGNIE